MIFRATSIEISFLSVQMWFSCFYYKKMTFSGKNFVVLRCSVYDWAEIKKNMMSSCYSCSNEVERG